MLEGLGTELQAGNMAHHWGLDTYTYFFGGAYYDHSIIYHRPTPPKKHINNRKTLYSGPYIRLLASLLGEQSSAVPLNPKP